MSAIEQLWDIERPDGLISSSRRSHEIEQELEAPRKLSSSNSGEVQDAAASHNPNKEVQIALGREVSNGALGL